ncbi:MAG: carbohydrate kinase family protein [Alphaproteobacteria bacterium]|nr:carbohydrate kinase family protein [Alphaproteobacteria bacterium]
MIIIFGYVCMESHLHLVNDFSQEPQIADKGAYSPGGAAANKAIAAARNGGRVNFIGTTGVDIFGQAIETFFHREGIQITGLAKSEKETGFQVFMHYDKQPTKSILFLGANEDSRLSQIPHSKLDARTLLLLEYSNDPDFSELLALAKNRQTITMIYSSDKIEKIDNADYIIFEGSELQPNSASNIITLSACRCFAHAQDKNGEVFSSEINKETMGGLLDDSGTFDSFCGSFSSCIQAGLPLANSLRYAHITSWLTGQKFGTNTAIPYIDSVETALMKAA